MICNGERSENSVLEELDQVTDVGSYMALDQMNVLIADDHCLYLKGITHLLQNHPNIQQIYEAQTFQQVLKQLDTQAIDLLLLDLKMPDVEGFDGVTQVRSHYPDLPLVIVSGSENHADVQAAVQVGVRGYIFKSLEQEQMIAALRNVIGGASYFPGWSMHQKRDLDFLSNRQKEILELINQGKSNRDISYVLGITEGTVGQHVHVIFRKLKVKNRSDAARVFRQYME